MPGRSYCYLVFDARRPEWLGKAPPANALMGDFPRAIESIAEIPQLSRRERMVLHRNHSLATGQPQ
jgi:hypothetical protein